MNWKYFSLAVSGILLALWWTWNFCGTASLPILFPQGVIAQQELEVIKITILLSSLIVIPVFFLLFFFAWKYRDKGTKEHRHHNPHWDHTSASFELLWWLAPAMIIAILSVVCWNSSHALDPYEPIVSANPPLTIEVVALDWKWLFIYPDQHIATVNMVEFPAQTPIHFVMTADAPMNSFWIPSLGGQIMVMPGMTTQLNLLANTAGIYNGFSGNISGKGFAGMTFTAHAVSQQEFDSWVSTIQYGNTVLDESSYNTLMAPSMYNKVELFSHVDSGLYPAIISSYNGTTTPTNTDDGMTGMSGMNNMGGMTGMTP